MQTYGNEINFSMQHLHKQYLKCKAELKHFKYLYYNECKENKRLHKLINGLKQETEQYKLQCEKVCRILRNMNEIGKNKRVSRKRKPWSNIRCDCTKHQRVCQYGKFVFSTIKENIPHCRRAQLCLFLGDKTVNYTWKSKDLKMTNLSQSASKHVTNGDHCYASIEHDTCSDDEEFEDVDYHEIFDFDGNWQKKHKRKIVAVMDSYHISHKAYHELRLAGKGHFPPLHHIIQEKKLMSDIIPYIKHPTVSNLLFVFILMGNY